VTDVIRNIDDSMLRPYESRVNVFVSPDGTSTVTGRLHLYGNTARSARMERESWVRTSSWRSVCTVRFKGWRNP
jgi:hypothetical protein